jgi:hypothetical protein
MKKFMKVRFFLFANSYSGKKIATYVKLGFQGKKLERAVKGISVIFDFRYDEISDFIVFDTKPKCPYQRLPNSLRVYLEIEKELSKLSEEKLDEYSTAMEDYQRQLLSPAIERAMGNLLEDVDDDLKFQRFLEEKSKSAIHTYYKVAYKYGLPTMRVVPFVLRLLGCNY